MQFDSDFPGVDFFADASDTTRFFAEFSVPMGGLAAPGSRKFVDINDPVFSSYLRVFVLPTIGRTASAKDLLQDLKDYFRLHGNPDKVSPRVRTAGSLRSGQIEYNLANDNSEFVRITPDGWKVSPKHTQKFLSSPSALPQITPVVGSRSLPQLMKPYVNIASEDDLLLLCTWLVQAFCDGNHLALLLMAGRGSGKSCLSKMLRQIIDPSRLGVCTMPDKLDALFATLSNALWVLSISITIAPLTMVALNSTKPDAITSFRKVAAYRKCRFFHAAYPQTVPAGRRQPHQTPLQIYILI